MATKKVPTKAPVKTPAKAPAKNTAKIQSKEDAASGLKDLFEESLKDIYWAEKALTKALPKMLKNATSPELRTALQEHLDVTKVQVSRLEEVFAVVGKKVQAKKCEAMEGLIKEAVGIMEDTEAGVVRDAGIIAGSQKIEHYEIATYGTLCAFAKVLGQFDAADLLHTTLQEEKDADSSLSELAERVINMSALGADDSAKEAMPAKTAKVEAPKKAANKKK